MKRFIFLWLVGLGVLCAQPLTPYKMLEAHGNVLDLVVHEGKVIASTDAGTIEWFDVQSGAWEKEVRFAPIKDFMGTAMAAKVYSVDVLGKGEMVLATVQGPTSYREVYVIAHGEKERVIGAQEGMMIKKAKFISPKRILLGLMSNELVLFDVETKKILYQFQLSQSHFSDFALNENKTLVVSSDESGEVHLVDVATGEVLQTYKGGNVDNVYKVDMKKERIITAGQDRRGIVYERTTGAFARFDAEFLLYACALSPSAALGAWAFTEDNAIAVFDIKSKARRFLLEGQRSTMNTIVFVDEKTLVSGSDDKTILLWRLP
ncbi:MAG: PQQ-binding-like beta-propeller repeat protein [Campylobacterales bacterium]|nr:PQQ-binding-like beta-propeller repeat protein [Campylobacterales bacterium]